MLRLVRQVGVATALLAYGLGGSWWVLDRTLAFTDPERSITDPASVATDLTMWLLPSSAVVAVLCWRAGGRRVGAARIVMRGAAVSLALLAALVLGTAVYSWMFPLLEHRFEPVPPDFETLTWLLASPAALGGAWLLLSAIRQLRAEKVAR